MKYKSKPKPKEKPTLKAEMPVGKQKNIKGEFVKIDALNEIAREKGIGAKDIPAEFTATVVDTEIVVDEFKRKCLNATVDIDGLGVTTIKYTPMHVEELVKSMQKIGVDDFKGKFKFKKVEFEIGFARPMPIEQIV